MESFNQFLSDLNGFDGLMLVLLLISVSLGIMRGLIREAFTLGGIAIASMTTAALSPLATARLAPMLGNETLARIFAVLGLFTASLILCQLLAHFLSEALKAVRLGSYNTWGGALFGVVRVALVGALIMIGGLAIWPDDTRAWMAGSRIAPLLRPLAHRIVDLVPRQVASMAEEILEQTKEEPIIPVKLEERVTAVTEARAGAADRTRDGGEPRGEAAANAGGFDQEFLRRMLNQIAQSATQN